VTISGCAQEAPPAPAANNPPGQQDAEVVVKAKYFRGKGPCIEGPKGTLAMPVLDMFQVVEVVKGRLATHHFGVRISPHATDYPRDLSEGEIYTLRLTLSENSRQQLQENENEGFGFIWVDGTEVHEHRPAGLAKRAEQALPADGLGWWKPQEAVPEPIGLPLRTTPETAPPPELIPPPRDITPYLP